MNLPVPGFDGTPLVTDIHLPEHQETPVPAVITRTPYGRSTHLAEGRSWRRHGMAYVVQDVRGRYDSEGHWTPYRNERGDGGALVDWVLAQPWCDGTVSTLGGSYAGYTAWAAAVERPEAVRQVISLGPSMGLHRTKFTPSGVLRLAEHVGWWLDRADGRTSREGLRDIIFSEHPEVLRHLPVTDIPALLGARMPHWDEALQQGAQYGYDGTPPEAITQRELAALDCATLHVAGWYDLLLGETYAMWQQTGTAHTPRPHRSLLVGPWGHDLGMSTGTVTGDVDHGPASRVSLGGRFIDWLRATRPDRPAVPDTSDVFVVNAGEWVSGPVWPPVETEPLTLMAAGDGALRDTVPPAADVSYRYDPRDPFPSALPSSNRSWLLNRDDAARFTSDPLRAPTTIQGMPVVHLHCTTTAAATDWVVRLLQLRDDNQLMEIASGACSTSGSGHHRLRVDLALVAVHLAATDRVMLEVTSSDFPYLARSLNTAENRCTGTAATVAHQTVHLGPGATHTVLPVSALPARAGDHHGE